MNSRTTRTAVLATAALSTGLAGAAPAQAKLAVVATLPDLAAVAREVGGELATVTALASPDEDPHYVDARPSLILPLARADLLIVNGMELEIGWLPPLQTQARNPRILAGGSGFFDASMAVTKLDVPAGRVDRSMGDVHPAGNPHFTHDPRAMAKVARALGDRLARIDPRNAGAYRQRAAATAASLDALAKEVAARFAAIPRERRRVVQYHKSLSYLLDWLGLEQTATIEPKAGIPPNPSHVAQVLTTMRATATRLILQEHHFPQNTTRTLARLAGARLVVIAGGTQFSAGETYADHLHHVTEEVFHALHD